MYYQKGAFQNETIPTPHRYGADFYYLHFGRLYLPTAHPNFCRELLENINLIRTYPKEGRLNFVVSRNKIYLYGRNFELPPTGSLDILEIDDKGQINVIQENIKNIGTPVAIRDDILFVSMNSIKDEKFNYRLTVLRLNSQGMISDKKDTVDYQDVVSLQFDEHYGYIADGFIGLVFFETSPNGKIIELGSYGSYGSPTCLGLDYPYVYIGSNAGIEIIDISEGWFISSRKSGNTFRLG